jgi:hypothetical protein
MSAFGRRVHPPGQPASEQTRKRPEPDAEQVKSWFNEVRSADPLPAPEPLPTRLARILGLKRTP